jgi:hypothetical protein
MMDEGALHLDSRQEKFAHGPAQGIRSAKTSTCMKANKDGRYSASIEKISSSLFR